MSEQPNDLFGEYTPYGTGDALAQSWAYFESKYEDDKAAFIALYKMIDEKTPHRCHHCHSANLEKLEIPRIFLCLDCHKKSWFTASTFFHNIRRAKAWLGAIWLLERGFKFSARRLAKLAEVAYDTAWNILKKLEIVVADNFAHEIASVPSSQFLDAVCKRSINTPANHHPVSEEAAEAAKHSPVHANPFSNKQTEERERESAINNLSEIELKIFEMLSNEAVSFDTLCDQMELPITEISSAISMLELLGLVKVLPGERYIHSPHAQPKKEKPVSENIDYMVVLEMIEFVKNFLHGISRKYLQLYSARFWCVQSRSRWGKDKLFTACTTANRTRSADILIYVSPLIVKVHISEWRQT